MDHLEIEGTDLYDGSHEFDATFFTLGELRMIKRISGLRRGELADAAAHDDTDLWVAFAVIALQRRMDEQGRGETVDEDVFWNGRNVMLRFVESEPAVEDDAGPPVTGGPSSEPAASNGNSGNASAVPSVLPVTVQQGTGTGSWDPSASAPSISPA